MGDLRHQTVRLELAQGFPNGGAANVKAGGEFFLGEVLAGGQLAAANAFAELAGDVAAGYLGHVDTIVDNLADDVNRSAARYVAMAALAAAQTGAAGC
jgi:hypothetical protein